MSDTLLLEQAPQTDAPAGEQPAPGEPPKKKGLRHPVYWLLFLVLCVFLVIKWLAFGSRSLSDAYLDKLQAPLDSLLSRVSYLCPLPVYELACFAAILIGIVTLVLLIVLCMKGIEESTGKRLSEVVGDFVDTEKTPVAVWVGPGHVQDFVKDIPNCMVMASAEESFTRELVEIFRSPLVRFYYGKERDKIEFDIESQNNGVNLKSI